MKWFDHFFHAAISVLCPAEVSFLHKTAYFLKHDENGAILLTYQSGSEANSFALVEQHRFNTLYPF